VDEQYNDSYYSDPLDEFNEFFGTKDSEKKMREKWDKAQAEMAKEGSDEDPSQPGGGKGKGGGGGDEGPGALLRKVTEIYTYISTKMPANSLT
jgi:hypothetical protein